MLCQRTSQQQLVLALGEARKTGSSVLKLEAASCKVDEQCFYLRKCYFLEILSSTSSLNRSTSRFDSFPSSVADHIVMLYSVSGARFFIVCVNLVVLNSYSEPPPEHEQISLNLSTFPSGASHFIDALLEKIRVAWIF